MQTEREDTADGERDEEGFEFSGGGVDDESCDEEAKEGAHDPEQTAESCSLITGDVSHEDGIGRNPAVSSHLNA